jgi:membrane protease YdiL (CAAX protease family)
MRDEAQVLKRECSAFLSEVHAWVTGIRRATWLTSVGAILAFSVVLVSSNITADGPIGTLVDDLSRRTNGWITAQLVHPALALGLMWLVFLRIGHLRGADVGWRTSALVPAFVTVVAFWLCSQASLWLLETLRRHHAPWNLRWRGGEGQVFAALTAQLLGNALVEETLFRGYLLPQLYLRLARVERKGVALAVALSVPLVLSAALHVPRFVMEEGATGSALIEALIFVLCFGLALSFAYLVTHNLFVCVGLHAVWNARLTLIPSPWQSIDTVWAVCTALLILGARIVRTPLREVEVSRSTVTVSDGGSTRHGR